jgi:sporulation protein YlmC with PRC-barrel domain
MDDEGDPIGYKVLPRGIPVVTSDGVEIGKVAKVLDNAREHIFDGIVVRTKERKVFVDAPEVERLYTKRVTLNIDAAAAAGLPPYKGMLGAMEHNAKRRVNRIKRNLGR